MADITNRELDRTCRKITQLLAKIKELEVYAKGISNNELADSYELEDLLKLSLADQKKYFLLSIVKEFKEKIHTNGLDKTHNRYDMRFDLGHEEWQDIQKDFLKVVDTTCPFVMNRLGEHRQPVLRWFKERMALVCTGVVGSVAVTLYNAYKAEKGTFSLSQIGFYSKTSSINKFNEVYTMLVDPEQKKPEISAF